jgi:hypothetical protein
MARTKDVRGKGKWSTTIGKRGTKIRQKHFKCNCNESYKKIKGTWVLRAMTVCQAHTDVPETAMKRLGKKLR